MTVCKPEYLRKDLYISDKSIPSMNERGKLINFIINYEYKNLDGCNSLEEASNEQLFATAHRIRNTAISRLEKYKSNLEGALSDWNSDNKGGLSDLNLSEGDKNIILEIKKRLKNGENKLYLEERFCIQLEHLPQKLPLYELFIVISKN